MSKINKHKIGEPNHHLESNLKPGNHRTSQSKVHVVEDTSSDFDELCFETIQIDSSSFNLGGLCRNQSRTAKC